MGCSGDNSLQDAISRGVLPVFYPHGMAGKKKCLLNLKRILEREPDKWPLCINFLKLYEGASSLVEKWQDSDVFTPELLQNWREMCKMLIKNYNTNDALPAHLDNLFFEQAIKNKDTQEMQRILNQYDEEKTTKQLSWFLKSFDRKAFLEFCQGLEETEKKPLLTQYNELLDKVVSQADHYEYLPVQLALEDVTSAIQEKKFDDLLAIMRSLNKHAVQKKIFVQDFDPWRFVTYCQAVGEEAKQKLLDAYRKHMTPREKVRFNLRFPALWTEDFFDKLKHELQSLPPGDKKQLHEVIAGKFKIYRLPWGDTETEAIGMLAEEVCKKKPDLEYIAQVLDLWRELFTDSSEFQKEVDNWLRQNQDFMSFQTQKSIKQHIEPSSSPKSEKTSSRRLR